MSTYCNLCDQMVRPPRCKDKDQMKKCTKEDLKVTSKTEVIINKDEIVEIKIKATW